MSSPVEALCAGSCLAACWVWLAAAFVVGAWVGMLIICLCVTAKRADEAFEQEE
jgi:uncharacterized membrane-anchored protein YhcB (DUF1043 family)